MKTITRNHAIESELDLEKGTRQLAKRVSIVSSDSNVLSLLPIAVVILNAVFCLGFLAYGYYALHLHNQNPYRDIAKRVDILAVNSANLARKTSDQIDLAQASIKANTSDIDHGQRVYDTAKFIIFRESDFQDFYNATQKGSRDIAELVSAQEWSFMVQAQMREAILESRKRQKALRTAVKPIAIRLRKARK